MNKFVLPALVIAAIGGYFYYTNLDAPAAAAEDSIAQDSIVEDVETAVAEAKASGVEVSKSADDMMASVEGDVFADVPEAMGHALDETSETAAADEAAEVVDEIDHVDE